MNFIRLVALILAPMSLFIGTVDAQELSVLARAFENARRAYGHQLETTRASMLRLHLERLEALEKKAADSGNYEAAEAYREERAKISADLGQMAKAPLTLILFPEEAELSGGAIMTSSPPRALSLIIALGQADLPTKREEALPLAGQLVEDEKAFERYLAKASPSSHQHFVAGLLDFEKQAADRAAYALAIQFSFGEKSSLVGPGREGLSHRLLPTKDTIREVSIGTLAMANAAPRLRLAAMEVYPLGLTRLQDIRLYPMMNMERGKRQRASWPENLRRSLNAALERKIEPFRKAYLEALQGLREEVSNQGDESLAKKLEETIAELEKRERQP